MKNLFTMIIFLIWGISNAQFVTNGTLNSTCQGDGYNAPSCVQGWQASHGTPSVVGTVGNNTSAWMWSYSNTGEGIYTNYNFQAGKTYQVSFKIRTSTKNGTATSAVLNSLAIVKAVTGLTTSSSTQIPVALNGGEVIWQRTIGTNINTPDLITVCYTPTRNNSQLCFYPLMTASSSANGNNQVQMEIDDVFVTPPVTSVFHFQDSNNIIKTEFCSNETIYLNGIASSNESQYYLDVWRRPIGSTAAFQWQTQLGGNGWAQGQLGILNLTSIFGNQGYTFIPGYEYQIKVATALPPCTGWVETTHVFTVLDSNASSLFTFNSFCAPDGTISVTVTANDTSAGVNHWWGLIESSVAGSTTDANSLGLVGSIQNGISTTFTGLSKDKNYYIKHGVYNSCVSWRETRTALPQTVSWSGYTTYFNFTQQSSDGTNVTVEVRAAINSVFVNHHWSISYAPNGSTSGSSPVNSTPTVSPDGMIATFNTNLFINTWYYIKHGTWNDCAPWGETRRAFRVVFLGKSATGEPNYVIETKEVKNVEVITEKIAQKNDNNSSIEQLYPNPITKGSLCTFTTDSKNVNEVIIMDLLGKSNSVKFSINNSDTITFPIDDAITKGIYIIKVVKKDNTIATKKLIVE